MGAIVVNAGRAGTRMVESVASLVPGEQVVAMSGDHPPENGEIAVTFPDEEPAIRALLQPPIRWIHLLSTGVDRFPFDALDGRILTCSRGASAVAISEWVMASILAFEKQFPETWLSEPPEQWNRADLGELRGTTLGLLGSGAIGTEIARRALAFSMDVVALRRSDQPFELPEIRRAAHIHDLFAQSHTVVVAAPATPATRRLVDAAALAAAPAGLHLVNISRGTLVDQDALIEALDSGQVARASLDVVDPEPLPGEHPLYRHPGVRLTAHVSWSGTSTMPRTFEIFADNVTRFRAGAELYGVVDPAERY